MGVHPLLWEHGSMCACADGFLSIGYIEAVLNLSRVRADGSSHFGIISILDIFPYCTPAFAHYVDEARKEHAPDEPLLALAKALDLDSFAESKNCELHGVVERGGGEDGDMRDGGGLGEARACSGAFGGVGDVLCAP